MRTAKHLKDIGGWSGDARLYELSEPTPYGWGEEAGTTSHVIVSAVDLPFIGGGCETYIFPATPDGETVNMLEMGGSLKGVKDHAEALRGAGYEIVQ